MGGLLGDRVYPGHKVWENKMQGFPVGFTTLAKELYSMDKTRRFTFSRLQFLEDEVRRAWNRIKSAQRFICDFSEPAIVIPIIILFLQIYTVAAKIILAVGD